MTSHKQTKTLETLKTAKKKKKIRDHFGMRSRKEIPTTLTKIHSQLQLNN